MTGNGSAASPNGSGNADVYYPDGGIHHGARGQAYIGDRAGRAVAEFLMAR